MGNALKKSRESLLPENIDSMETYLRDQCNSRHSRDVNNSSQSKNVPTLGKDLPVAINVVQNFLVTNNINNLKILEVMAGNCVASIMLEQKIQDNVKSWIRTDIGNYSEKSEQMDAIDAVEKYGNQSNLLLMICPPPGSLDLDQFIGACYGDYFACKKFIETKKEDDKYIIFVGELGASDGSDGMYRYMLEHPKLQLLGRKMIHEERKDSFGGPLEKEVFLFLIN